MNAETKRFQRFAVIYGIVFFLATSSITSPGWRTDSTGRIADVERHFGWPCEYYADVWKRVGNQEPRFGLITTVYPPPGNTTLQSYAVSPVALGLNLLFAACLSLLIALIGRIADRNEVELRVALGAGLAMITALLILVFGDYFFGAYL